MAKFTSYPNKSKPADSDTLLINDASASANKQILLSGLFAWLKDKFTSTPINGLETTNQTIVGAINELHDAVEEGGSASDIEQIRTDLDDLEDRVDALESGSGGSGLTAEIKQALLACFNHVAWDDDDPTGQSYITDLENALYQPIPATAISLSSNSLTINTLNSTQTLTATLTPSNSTSSVAWSSSNSAVATVNNGVVTAIGYGTATITATAGSVSATCSVIVAQVNLSSINASYTQSGTVYNTDALDSLKSDLVVTATWSDSSTSILNGADYTLSGTLTVGTSTITVSYGGKTDTFTVTVSQYDSSIYNWDFTQSLVDSKQGATATLGSGVTRDASGLTFDGTTNAYVHLADMSSYATSSFTVEVDVNTLVSGGTLIDLNTQSGLSDNPCGLIFSGHWYFRLTSNSNATLADSTLTDPTIFNGHTVKCQFDYANKLWTVYNNGTLVGSVTAYQKSNGRNQLGLSANYSSRFLGNGTVITAVRVYEGVV